MKSQRQGGFLIAKIHQLGGRIFARILKQHHIDQLNPAQGRIMFALWQNDGIPIAELARRTSLGKSTLTSMLDRLEKSDYLRRVPSPADRRETLIKRTDKDRAMQHTYMRVSWEMNKLFYAGFSDTEIDKFESYLKRLLENLERAEV
jgi:DNA-binding MarR family transcriptional regulator